MEPGSNLPSLADNNLLLILIFFAAADLLAAVILRVYRYLIEEDIVIPGGEDKRDDRPVSEQLLDDPALIGKLRMAARFLSGLTAGFAVIYTVRMIPFQFTLPLLTLCVFCVWCVDFGNLTHKVTIARYLRLEKAEEERAWPLSLPARWPTAMPLPTA